MDLRALSVDIGGWTLELRHDLVEARRWNADGHRRRMTAAIGLSRLLDESTNADND
jgi:hypothetical protein